MQITKKRWKYIREIGEATGVWVILEKFINFGKLP